jgi:hypothetical protein
LGAASVVPHTTWKQRLCQLQARRCRCTKSFSPSPAFSPAAGSDRLKLLAVFVLHSSHASMTVSSCRRCSNKLISLLGMNCRCITYAVTHAEGEYAEAVFRWVDRDHLLTPADNPLDLSRLVLVPSKAYKSMVDARAGRMPGAACGRCTLGIRRHDRTHVCHMRSWQIKLLWRPEALVAVLRSSAAVLLCLLPTGHVLVTDHSGHCLVMLMLMPSNRSLFDDVHGPDDLDCVSQAYALMRHFVLDISTVCVICTIHTALRNRHDSSHRNFRCERGCMAHFWPAGAPLILRDESDTAALQDCMVPQLIMGLDNEPSYWLLPEQGCIQQVGSEAALLPCRGVSHA